MRKVLVFVIATMFTISARPQSEPPPGQQEPEKPKPEAGADQAAAPVPPPRVLGQAQTQEELDAYNRVEAGASPQEKVMLGKNFLEVYPDSGLTPFVHKTIALSYQETNDYENFVTHAESALEEIPEDPDLLGSLARGHAERGENNKAIERSRSALTVLENMEKPDHMGIVHWTIHRDRLMADANYAQGLALMKKSLQMSASGTTVLERAVGFLEEAARLDPTDDASFFRLGFAYARLNNADQALLAYARAVAVDGVAASLAIQQLQRIYEFVHKNTDGVSAMVDEQRAWLEARKAERQAQLDELQKQEDLEKQQQQQTLPPTLPPA